MATKAFTVRELIEALTSQCESLDQPVALTVISDGAALTVNEFVVEEVEGELSDTIELTGYLSPFQNSLLTR